MRGGGDSAKGLVERPVGQDGQDRPEDLVLHDPVVPAHRIDDRRVEVAGSRIGSAADDHLRRIDQAREAR